MRSERKESKWVTTYKYDLKRLQDLQKAVFEEKTRLQKINVAQVTKSLKRFIKPPSTSTTTRLWKVNSPCLRPIKRPQLTKSMPPSSRFIAMALPASVPNMLPSKQATAASALVTPAGTVPGAVTCQRGCDTWNGPRGCPCSGRCLAGTAAPRDDAWRCPHTARRDAPAWCRSCPARDGPCPTWFSSGRHCSGRPAGCSCSRSDGRRSARPREEGAISMGHHSHGGWWEPSFWSCFLTIMMGKKKK
jgi:hypothetical protein